MVNIAELQAEEQRVQQQLASLVAEHERYIAPLKARLKEIERQWPKRKVSWYDLETGAWTGDTYVRIETNEGATK